MLWLMVNIAMTVSLSILGEMPLGMRAEPIVHGPRIGPPDRSFSRRDVGAHCV